MTQDQQSPAGSSRRQFLGSAAGLGLGVAITPWSSTARAAGAQDVDQSLRVASFYQPASLAPQAGGHQFMQANVFLPPFIPDRDGVLQPGVCTDWSMSDDGLIYTLTIDPAAVFSDGAPVTAADIKYSWEMFCRPENGFTNQAYALQPIAGYQEAITGDTSNLSGLVAIDDRTVQITLSAPNAAFIKMISIYTAGVTKREVSADGQEQISDNPIGAGPFRVASWDRNNHQVVWEPSETWWRTPPTITRIEHQFVEDANTQALLYENDEIDFFRPNPAIVTQLQLAGSTELVGAPYSGTWFFYFKVLRPPMDDTQVRTALVKSIQMEAIAQAVFQGTTGAANGIWPPLSIGYEPRSSQFDPDAARAALASSTYGSAGALPPITLVINPARPEFVRVAEAMQQMWQDVLGVSVEILPTGDPSPTAQIGFGGQAALTDDPGSFANDFGLSEGNLLSSLVESSVPGLDETIQTANQLAVDAEEERIAIYRSVEDTLLSQAFYIPVVPLIFYYAVKPWVQGFAANTSLTVYTLSTMRVEGR